MEEKCVATTNSGKPCQGKALENGFCFAHQPKGEIEQKDVCKHINKHYWAFKEELGHSVLEDLACELQAGHDGPHSANVFSVSFHDNEISEQGNKDVFWGDDAGTPADEIKPDPDSLLKLYKDREDARLREAIAKQ